MKLNGYDIYWAISVVNNKISEYKWGTSKEEALKKLKPKTGCTVYFITDKQFGYIQNSWTSEFSENNTPLKNTLKLENLKYWNMGSLISLFDTSSFTCHSN